MADSLTPVDKSWVAAKASLNASYRPREGSEGKVLNAGIKTEEIRTLAEYRKMNPEKLSTWNPEKEDIDKLMEIYVVPIVLPTGEQIDVVVNQKGQDMACIYLDESSNERSFHLTTRMQNELKRSMVGTELKMDPKEIERILTPKTLEEFTELAAKDKLVPKNPEEVKDRVKEANGRTDSEEQEQEGMTIEEASATTGINKDILEEFADENGMIVGIRKTTDIEGLSQELDYELGNASSEVILLRVNDGTTQNKGYVLDSNGNIMYSSLDGRGNPEVVTDIVRTGSNGDSFESVDEAIKDAEAESREVEYTSISEHAGLSKNVEYAKKGSEKEIQGYEKEAMVKMTELMKKIKSIEESSAKESEKFQQRGDTIYATSQELSNLQTAYGVHEPRMIEELNEMANDAWGKVPTAKLKEDALGVGEAVVEAVAGALMGEDALMNTSREEDDDDNPYAKYSQGRLPKHLMDN